MIDRMTALEDVVRDMLNEFVPYHNEVRYRILDKLKALPPFAALQPEQEVDEEEYVRMLSQGPDDVARYAAEYRSLYHRGYRIVKGGAHD